jgi:hypothetical protein
MAGSGGDLDAGGSLGLGRRCRRSHRVSLTSHGVVGPYAVIWACRHFVVRTGVNWRACGRLELPTMQPKFLVSDGSPLRGRMVGREDWRSGAHGWLARAGWSGRQSELFGAVVADASVVP